MRFVVFGGGRMIGPPLVRAASADAVVVMVVNRSSVPPPGLANVRHLPGDRGDPVFLARLARLRPDVVVDLSGYKPRHVQMALEHLCGIAARYILMSSGAVYQASDLLPWDETCPLAADRIWGQYGADKCSIEHLLPRYAGRGTDLVTLRAPYLVGHPDFMHRLHFIADRIVHGGLVFLPGGGDAAIQLASAHDVAAALMHLVTIPFGVKGRVHAFNLGSSEFTTLAGLVRLTARALAAEVPRLVNVDLSAVGLRDAPFSHDDMVFPFANWPLILDDRKLRSTGFRPAYGLPALLADFVTTYRADGGPCPPVHYPAERRALKLFEHSAETHPNELL